MDRDPSIDKEKLSLLLQDVQGWLPIEDAWYLYESARKSPAAIVEIGSYQGRSSIALGLGASKATDSQPVFSIEPHAEFIGAFGGSFGPSDREAYFHNLLQSGLCRYVALINLTSRQASAGWQREIGLLFIDGDHRYQAVKEDVTLWLPHLITDGIVVFDDTFIPNSGPLTVFTELLASGGYVEIPAAGKLRAVKKIRQ